VGGARTTNTKGVWGGGDEGRGKWLRGSIENFAGGKENRRTSLRAGFIDTGRLQQPGPKILQRGSEDIPDLRNSLSTKKSEERCEGEKKYMRGGGVLDIIRAQVG